jgi:hypothetical protein
MIRLQEFGVNETEINRFKPVFQIRLLSDFQGEWKQRVRISRLSPLSKIGFCPTPVPSSKPPHLRSAITGDIFAQTTQKKL